MLPEWAQIVVFCFGVLIVANFLYWLFVAKDKD
jgi:hypothetical protein